MPAPTRKARMNGHTKACRDLVAFITAAGEAGFEVQCRTYAPHHDYVSCSVVLTEEHPHWHTSTAGSFSIHTSGDYAGDETMTHATGVGIALAVQAGVIPDERARALTKCGYAGNEKTAQTEWLDRAKRVQARRAAYSAWMDAGCPDGTFEAHQAAQLSAAPAPDVT